MSTGVYHSIDARLQEVLRISEETLLIDEIDFAIIFSLLFFFGLLVSRSLSRMRKLGNFNRTHRLKRALRDFAPITLQSF